MDDPSAKRDLVILLTTVTWLLGACDGGGASDDALAEEDLADTADSQADTSDADIPGEDDPVSDPPPDASDPDGDEGEPPPDDALYCKACTWDMDCGPGGECAALDGGEMSCATPCSSPEDCPDGAQCASRADGATRCVPNTGSCTWSSMGSPCPAWGCSGREGTCSDPSGDHGYCTHECTTRADCDAGFNRCEDRGDGVWVCLEDLVSPWDRCGTVEHADGVGSPCDSSTCADPVFVCTDGIDATLPGFCTFACTTDGECGADGRCAALPGTDGTERWCVPDECSCLDTVPGSMLDTGLEAAGLTRCDLGWPEDSVQPYEPEFKHDRFRLPWFDDVHNDWLRGGPAFAADLESSFDSAVDAGFANVIEEAARRSGHPVVAGSPGWTPDPTDPLARAMMTVMDVQGETGDLAAYQSDAADVPADLQDAVAVVLLAVAEAIEARDRALAGTIGEDEWAVRTWFQSTPGYVIPMGGSPPSPTLRTTQDLLIGDIGYEEIYQAAWAVARALEDSGLAGIADPGTGFDFRQSTPAGLVIVSDGADDTHDGALSDEAILLLVDTGGDDVYRVSAGGNVSESNPVSIAVDLSGRDTYGYEEVPDPRDGTRPISDSGGRAASPNPPFSISDAARQGAGRLGIGMLFDLGTEGDDYASLRMSQGFGSLGVGLLWDAGGDDSYRCEAACQGAGIFGLGILVDRGEGIDEYSSWHASQGFAYVQAVGLLHDAGGGDDYLCDQDDILYTSAQDPDGSNSSLCQGMGFGRRADVAYGGDGVFMSGGLGILRDLAGDDTYEAAVFAQGSGYWFAFGALLDGGGNDAYDARWYVQGAGAHYANGLLHDASGDDRYNETEDRRLNVTLGGGHDYSIAFLIDDAGSDAYFSPNLSLGAGNDNGFGLLLDRSGADSYECSSDFSLGNALTSPFRWIPLSAGIFLDAGGVDGYTRPDTTSVADDSLWLQTRTGAENEHGIGVDVNVAGEPGI